MLIGDLDGENAAIVLAFDVVRATRQDSSIQAREIMCHLLPAGRSRAAIPSPRRNLVLATRDGAPGLADCESSAQPKPKASARVFPYFHLPITDGRYALVQGFCGLRPGGSGDEVVVPNWGGGDCARLLGRVQRR